MQQAGSQHKVAKNAAWIISCRVIQALMGLVVGALTARYLGPSNFGSINYAASLTAFIAPVLYLGLNATLVHELITREKREGEVMGTSLFIGSLASVVCFLGRVRVRVFRQRQRAGDRHRLLPVFGRAFVPGV